MKRSKNMIIWLTEQEENQISVMANNLNITKSEVVRIATNSFINKESYIYIKDGSVSNTLAELCDLCSLIENDAFRKEILEKLGELECRI